MVSRRVLTVLIALLMISAGCLGGGDDSGGDGASGGDAAGSDQSDDGPGAGDGGSSDDSDELELSDQEAVLRDAGSFTVVWEFHSVDETGSETDVTREFYADLENERSLTRISSARNGEPDSGSSDQFFADGVTYVRSGPEDASTYFSYEQESADVVATAIALSQARAYGADDGLAFRGSETFDGVQVERYELSQADSQLIQAGSAAGVAAGAGSPTTQITDFQYAVLVDENGLSRFESYAVTGETEDGETVTFEWEYSITDVGSTTVDDPDWLEEAKAQSQS